MTNSDIIKKTNGRMVFVLSNDRFIFDACRNANFIRIIGDKTSVNYRLHRAWMEDDSVLIEVSVL